MTLMSSSLTTQRHTNPSMVLFCVHFLYTHKYRYSRTYKQITKDFFLYLGNNCRVFGTFQKNETIIYPIALFIHHKVTISFILKPRHCCSIKAVWWVQIKYLLPQVIFYCYYPLNFLLNNLTLCRTKDVFHWLVFVSIGNKDQTIQLHIILIRIIVMAFTHTN